VVDRVFMSGGISGKTVLVYHLTPGVSEWEPVQRLVVSREYEPVHGEDSSCGSGYDLLQPEEWNDGGTVTPFGFPRLRAKPPRLFSR
jgi:hypothetical protein